MSGAYCCPCCERSCAGLTLYLAFGAWSLLVCAKCYRGLVAHEHQPHSQPMRRLHQLLAEIVVP